MMVSAGLTGVSQEDVFMYGVQILLVLSTANPRTEVV